jgi:4-hydroxy-3-polyprenylbenzoate decarboxylase
MKIAVGITGASGSIYGLRFLEALKKLDIESHLVVSDAGDLVARHELGFGRDKLAGHADHHYDINSIDSALASGSFLIDAMVIIPCSMNTMGCIASGISLNLIHRCANVILKEGKKLVLVLRETPYSPVDMENMLKLSHMGITILPASPAFYHRPKTIEGLVDQIVGKALDALSIKNDLFKRWGK